jgi:hypothetical protein
MLRLQLDPHAEPKRIGIFAPEELRRWTTLPSSALASDGRSDAAKACKADDTAASLRAELVTQRGRHEEEKRQLLEMLQEPRPNPTCRKLWESIGIEGFTNAALLSTDPMSLWMERKSFPPRFQKRHFFIASRLRGCFHLQQSDLSQDAKAEANNEACQASTGQEEVF